MAVLKETLERRVTSYPSRYIFNKLKETADRNGISVSKVITEIAREHFKKEEGILPKNALRSR